MSSCNFVRAARLKLVLVKDWYQSDTFRPLDWYQSKYFHQYFFRMFCCFLDWYQSKFDGFFLLMFLKVARNKAYRSHAYIMDFYWEKIQAHQCRNPRDKKKKIFPSELWCKRKCYFWILHGFLCTPTKSHHWIQGNMPSKIIGGTWTGSTILSVLRTKDLKKKLHIFAWRGVEKFPF